MASSSLNVPRRKYEVFLSFRGVDTRRTIVSHLLKALGDKKIEVFSDYKLEEGNEISPALLRSIEESYITLIIFSEGYADSKWCLEELEKIINCMENFGQIVVPIFYNVVPSTIRYQRECYGDALRRHEEKYKVDKSKIQSWKTSLEKAANLSGFDSSKFENDAELVERIVNRVWEILKNSVPQNDSTGLIGIHEQIEVMELLLSQRKKDIQIVGIWGMGGIGKTTIASILFRKICHEYEGYHFLESVREELGKHGITQLKNRLISKLFGEQDLGITIPIGLPFYIQGRLRHKKVLVVLDDVDDSEQLKDITGAYDWFGPGSTIITTSRDKSTLSKYSSKIHEVMALNSEQSHQLLNLHAFKDGCLKFESSHELSSRVIDHVKGNPLALKVLGSYLNDKSEAEWRSALAKLEKTPFPKIQRVLKLSFDALDQCGKNIFLYIACFFKGFLKWDIISLLDSSLYPTIGLKDLENKALISSYKKVTMHDLIQEMGRQIVLEESLNNPSKLRHLWDYDDIYEVFKNNLGTKDIESITLRSWRVKKIHLDSKAFKGMTNLKYLNFQCKFGLYISDSSLDFSSQELKYFNWAWYPLKTLPSNFCLKNLVQLHLRHSKVERLWDGIQEIENLKKIDLSDSRFLKELPDMSKASKLEIVKLTMCRSLRYIDPSILSNHNLVELDLWGCVGLRNLKFHDCLRSIKYLVVSHCQNLEEFPLPITLCQVSPLTTLDLRGTNVERLPASIKHLSNLERLDLSSCSRLQCIPKLSPSVKVLLASYCSSLEAVFTSNSSTHYPRLNPRYPFKVDLRGCEKLGEDTINAIVMDFVLVTMGSRYQQPTLSEPYLFNDCSEACLPISKVPNVLNFKTRQGCESESIQVPPNSDLMTFIFCFVFGGQPEAVFKCRLDARVISNGERIKYGKNLQFGPMPIDHVLLWYDEAFNRNILNIIKQSRSASSSIDECTKVSFELYPLNNKVVALEIGVCPIYAPDTQPQLRIKKRKRKQLALQKGVISLNLSKQLLPHSRKDKRKSRNLKAIHLQPLSTRRRDVSHL